MANFKSILPPALAGNPNAVWSDLADSTSATWEQIISPHVNTLKSLQDLYIANTESNSSSEKGILIDTATGFDMLDLTTVQRELAALGLRLKNPDKYTTEQLNKLYQTLGQYWKTKGDKDIVHYIASALGISVSMSRMWTADYVKFVPELEYNVCPGVPIWEAGGTLYPTTHVLLAYDPTVSYNPLDLVALVQIFYALCSYTIVLKIVVASVLVSTPLKAAVGLVQQKVFWLGLDLDTSVGHYYNGYTKFDDSYSF